MALALGAALAFSACSSTPETKAPAGNVGDSAEEGNRFPLTVTDIAGNEVTIESLDSIVITDNRLFQLASDWDIELSAAPRSLMSENNPLKNDETIIDLGSHRAPDLEGIVAADPTIIINGYRYSGHGADLQKEAPDAAFLSMDIPEGEEMSVDEYVSASLTLMGEIFDREDEASALIDEFHDAIQAAKDAYDPSITVMGLVATGSEINYSNPLDGRGSSIFFDLLDMTPALETEGSSNHQGDDINLEAIAQTNADFFLVLDRAAAVAGEGDDSPAIELITGSATLASVPAVVNNAIYIMPDGYYLTEDIFAYMTVLNGLADAFSKM